MTDEKRISTDELLQLLFKERDLEKFLQRNESSYLDPSFSEYLTGWCKTHKEVPEQLIRRANLEKSFGHQLFSGKRKPSRDTVVLYCLHNGVSLLDTEIILQDLGLPILGGRDR